MASGEPGEWLAVDLGAAVTRAATLIPDGSVKILAKVGSQYTVKLQKSIVGAMALDTTPKDVVNGEWTVMG